LQESTALSPVDRSHFDAPLQLVVQLAPHEPEQSAPSLQLRVQLVVVGSQPPSAFQSHERPPVHWQTAPTQVAEVQPSSNGAAAIAATITMMRMMKPPTCVDLGAQCELRAVAKPRLAAAVRASRARRFTPRAAEKR
jgi:hypothetical protein